MMAAGLSFYTMLSLTPALWILVAAAGMVIGRDSAKELVIGWLGRNIGPNAAVYLDGIVRQANESRGYATIGGAIAMLLGASLAFGALQNSLNRIWQQVPSAELGILATLVDFTRQFFTRRALAFVIMLLLGILLLASLFTSAALAFLAEYLPANLPAPSLILGLADLLASIVLMTLLFGALFHLLHKQAFCVRAIWTGALLTSILFLFGKVAIGLYLGGAAWRSAYGAAGSLVLLLLWIYYSVQIFLFGAEFTDVYSRRLTDGSPPLG